MDERGVVILNDNPMPKEPPPGAVAYELGPPEPRGPSLLHRVWRLLGGGPR
jgi:hypothetical protein